MLEALDSIISEAGAFDVLDFKNMRKMTLAPVP
jgi:hypothetical protein